MADKVGVGKVRRTHKSQMSNYPIKRKKSKCRRTFRSTFIFKKETTFVAFKMFILLATFIT